MLVWKAKWTVIWVAAGPDQLLGRDLGTSEGWARRFDAMTQKTETEFAPPWRGSGQRFWSFYAGPRYQTISGLGAWRHLVPLRVGMPPTTQHAYDLFVWPHAVGAVLTVTVNLETGYDQNVWSPANLADAVVDAARVATYHLPCHLFGAAPANATSTIRAGTALILGARGAVPDQALEPGSPFIVATVLVGYGDRTPEVHKGTWRVVHALADPHLDWRTVGLPPATEGRVSMRPEPPPEEGGLYGVARGRAVWEPNRFSEVRHRKRGFDGLDCYHRNLVSLALQIEGHLALIKWAWSKLGTGKLSFDAENLVRWSALSLRDLYAGTSPNTYRSASARRHIEQDDFMAVRDAWTHFGAND